MMWEFLEEDGNAPLLCVAEEAIRGALARNKQN